MDFKFVIDTIIAGFDSEVMQKNRLNTVYVYEKEMHFCKDDIRSLAEKLNLKVQYARRDDDEFNAEVYVIYRGWKLFGLDNVCWGDDEDAEV